MLDELTAKEETAHLLGRDVESATPFGAGKFSDVFAVTSGGEEYILRVAPPDSVLQTFYEYRMMRQEPAIHARLLAETEVPVPQILAHDFSRERIDRDFLVMPRLPGIPLSDATLSPSARNRTLREWGRWVRDIHGVIETENRFGYVGDHQCMDPQADWRSAFEIMYGKLLDDIAACGIYDVPTRSAAMGLLQNNLAVFEACETSRLCHGDLWVTNVLVDRDGGVTGVLDFDRACWGDVEWDLAIAEYCGVTQNAFWEGYGTTIETHEGDAAVRRMFYLLYEHQKYIVISMSSRRNDPARARRYADENLAVMDRFRRTGMPGF